jgi:DNA adenine methylase
VPIGSYRKVYPLNDIDLFKSITETWIFSHGCYSRVDISGVDLAFSDPPYEDVGKSKKSFKNYSGRFGPEQQLEHLNWLVDMDVPTIACNNPNVALAKEYRRRGFQVYRIKAPRSISCKAGGRKPVFEMLALRGFGKSRKFGTLIEGAELWRV